MKREREREGGPGVRIVKELARRREDDESDVSIAKNRELLGFLEEASSSLGESDLPRRHIVDFPDLNLVSCHFPDRTKEGTQN